MSDGFDFREASRGSMLRCAIWAVLLFCGMGAAGAELPGILKPLSAKFEADNAALVAAGEAQLKPARERYLTFLAAAARTATAAAKTGDIAAINAEIEGTRSDSLSPDFPADLPRGLATERRIYVTVAGNVAKTIPPRQRELAANYLKTLATAEAEALKNRDTAGAEAIAAEKTRVVGLLEAAGGGQKNRTVVVNGDFSQGEVGAWPLGWVKSTEVSVGDATIIAEGTERFLRVRRLQALQRANLKPEKEIVIPAKAKWVEFSVRIRAKGVVPGKDWDKYPGLKLSARDGRDEEVTSAWGLVKQDTNWQRVTGRMEIAPTAKTLRINIGPHNAAAIVDFDDVTVAFR
jgi:hypothetical protein